MPSGTSRDFSELPVAVSDLFAQARRAVLATAGRDGRAKLVPVCFALRAGNVVTAVDRKPKGGRRLARLRNIERDARASVLVDRWDEDWSRLGWARVEGSARVDPPGSADAELRARYPQYGGEPPDGEVIVVVPERIVWWTWGRS